MRILQYVIEQICRNAAVIYFFAKLNGWQWNSQTPYDVTVCIASLNLTETTLLTPFCSIVTPYKLSASSYDRHNTPTFKLSSLLSVGQRNLRSIILSFVKRRLT